MSKLLTFFFSKNFQHICVSLDLNFNESLTNDVVSFEQLGPAFFLLKTGRSRRWMGYCLHKGNSRLSYIAVVFLGPVVQSVVSLTSSLRVISLTVLADSIYNILIFFAEKM